MFGDNIFQIPATLTVGKSESTDLYFKDYALFCNRTVHIVYISVTKWCIVGQCLKLMVAQSPLVTKNWAGPIKFDPRQVKIIKDYMRK